MQNSANRDSKLEHDDEDDSRIFPQKVMEMLSNDSYSEAICWLPHGKAFFIRNRDLFVETVMPKFFSRKAKYSSFMRKLKRWNFSRVSRGPEIGAYYNEFFCRTKPQLVAQMFCQNARTKLAMSNNQKPEKKAPSPAASMVSEDSSPPCDPEVNSIANKDVAEEMCVNNTSFISKPCVANIQVLERQMQLLQQAYAQQLFLQQQLATKDLNQNAFQLQLSLALQQQQLQQYAGGQATHQLQQFAAVDNLPRRLVGPYNGRASAA